MQIVTPRGLGAIRVYRGTVLRLLNPFNPPTEVLKEAEGNTPITCTF